MDEIVLAAALMSLGAVTAQALPAAPVQQAIEVTDVIKVAQGCGPGWARNAYGACRADAARPRGGGSRRGGPRVVTPRVYGGCPRGMFRTRSGRCVWR